MIKSIFFFLIDFIIENFFSNIWISYIRRYFEILQDKCDKQNDESNCEIHIIYNIFALIRKKQFFITTIDSRTFQFEYVIFLIEYLLHLKFDAKWLNTKYSSMIVFDLLHDISMLILIIYIMHDILIFEKLFLYDFLIAKYN